MKSCLHDIHVSRHAYRRIKQRLGTKDKKIPHLVEKAWHSENQEIPKSKKAAYKTQFMEDNRICRPLMGYVWIFAIDEDKKTLVTVY